VSSSSKLSTEGGEYFFRTVPSDNLQAEMLADWVIKDGIKKVAIIYTNNSWGKPLTDGFSELFTKNGGEIVFSEGIQENTADLKTIILKLKKSKFDAIVSPTYPKEGGLLVKQLKEAGISSKLYGGDNWGSPEFLAIAKNSAEEACFTFPSESKSPLFQEFSSNFQKKYNIAPDIISAYGYDAATAIIEAIKKAANLSGTDIKNSLRTVSFEGVSGKIAFRSNGDIISNGYGKRKIVNGKSISLN
jgi:branched-chain amino acid transport system substrate-binding protein